MDKTRDYPLIGNVEEYMSSPSGATETFCVRGTYEYYHYLCDKFLDAGWGCGFRVLQTVCSWIDSTTAPFSIEEMTGLLDRLDPGWNPTKSRKPWIGTYEGFLIIDHAYDVSCRIIHLKSPADLDDNVRDLLEKHFSTVGSPIFLGGSKDCYGKCVLGICQVDGIIYFLTLDPHFTGMLENAEDAQRKGCVRWIPTNELLSDSFYNFLLPLSHGKLKIPRAE